MIADPAGASQTFDDDTIQAKLDESRDDIRYLQLSTAPSIVNTTSTGNQPGMIFADFYSENYKYWEDDLVLQGYLNSAFWKVLTPAASENMVGHWQFETSVFTAGTVPGQYPPVFITGKVYDIFATAADLLDMKAMTLSLTTYDFSTDGQSFKVSQMIDNIRKAAADYRRQAKTRVAKMVRHDIRADLSTSSVPILGGGNDLVKGNW